MGECVEMQSECESESEDEYGVGRQSEWGFNWRLGTVEDCNMVGTAEFSGHSKSQTCASVGRLSFGVRL